MMLMIFIHASLAADPDDDLVDSGNALNQVQDNCPNTANPSQSNIDNDTQGDACDADIDGDGTLNDDDAFPNDAAETADADGDNIGDNSDNCPAIANNDQADVDNDGDGNACDLDADNDGVNDVDDAFPFNPDEQLDTDGDSVGDNADAFPNDPSETSDLDEDGVGDNGDNCPTIANSDQADADNDGEGDACEVLVDADEDGLFTDEDNCPLVFNPEQQDADSDGLGDACDNCPNAPNLDQLDADFNGIGDACDISTSAQKVHFDFFYNQLSSEANGFKVAVVGETVTQADGTIDIGVGVDSTTLDLGEEGAPEGAFKVWADYAATEVSLSYSGADLSGADCYVYRCESVLDGDLTFVASVFHRCVCLLPARNYFLSVG